MHVYMVQMAEASQCYEFIGFVCTMSSEPIKIKLGIKVKKLDKIRARENRSQIYC